MSNSEERVTSVRFYQDYDGLGQRIFEDVLENVWRMAGSTTFEPVVRLSSNRFKKDYAERFFDDGLRLIDYILVYNNITTDLRRTIFLSALKEIGIELEEVPSWINPHVIFVKVHGPKRIHLHFAAKYDIPIKKLQRSFIRAPIPKLKCFRTELTSQDPSSPNYHRAIETFSGNKPTKCSRNERILIMYSILKRVVYGPNKTTDIGIHHLLDNDVFVAAYAPHDGTSLWNDNMNDPLNDRQLLRKYWSGPRNFFKSQPLDVIENYFGDNIALYFAWLAFYNKMLLGPIVIGLIVTLFNYSLFSVNPVTVNEACKSNIILCPTCSNCKAQLLKNSCINYKLAYVTDNYYTIVFAAIMSFWAAIYMVLWKRKQSVLAIRWNIRYSDLEEQDVRPEFENFAKNVRTSEFGEPELYIPIYTKFWRKSVSILVSLIMVALMTYIHTVFIVIEIEMGRKLNNSLLATFLGAIILIFVILMMRRVCIALYEPIAIWLVDLEVPQTQTDFDNSYIIKIFLFSFVNNYTSLIYTAYFKFKMDKNYIAVIFNSSVYCVTMEINDCMLRVKKISLYLLSCYHGCNDILTVLEGKFYTHPNDPKMYNNSLELRSNMCNPSGCTSEVYIMFQIIITFLPLINQLSNYCYENIKLYFSRAKEKKAHILHSSMPRWEKDYELNDTKPYDLLKLYEEMVVQFGFVTVFAFAFPAAPLFALINSLIKTHIDAHNLVVKYRRPLAKRTVGVGAWMDIMTFLTYFSIVTNACYMTFTSDFVSKQYYLYNFGNTLEGYINFTLSAYRMNTNHWPNANIPNGSICWYPGHRNPPDHMRPYELSFDHYYMVAIKIGVILAFEHIISTITAIISYTIPSVPAFIREKYAVETMELRKYLSEQPSFSSESVLRLAVDSPKEHYLLQKKK